MCRDKEISQFYDLISFYSSHSADKNAGGGESNDHFVRPLWEFHSIKHLHSAHLRLSNSMRLWLSIPEEISARFALLLSAFAHRSKLFWSFLELVLTVHVLKTKIMMKILRQRLHQWEPLVDVRTSPLAGFLGSWSQTFQNFWTRATHSSEPG